MRILQVITGLPKAAGTSVFCGELANGLVALGHDVTIAVCDPSAPDLYPLDPSVHCVSIESVLRSSSPPASSTSFSLVHIHAIWSPSLHRISVWARKNNIPVVWSPHGMITPWAMNNKRWKKRLAWHLYQKRDLASAALLHATAPSEVDDIRRLGLTNKVVIAPLGVHLPPSRSHTLKPSHFQTLTPSHLQTLKPSNLHTLLFVSRVQRKKGLPMLLNALAKIKTSHPDLFAKWVLRIVGPDQEGHVAELKSQCDTLGLTWVDETLTPSNPQTFAPSHPHTLKLSDLVFVGPKFGTALACEYAAADLFALPTHSENFGSVVIEALAHDVPVICTKGAPWQELEEYQCGHWVDIDEREIVKALLEMMSMSNGERLSMGEKGRALVKARYVWPVICKGLSGAYERIVI